MERLKAWLKPLVFVVVWIAVFSYTVSMVATVEPTLRRQRHDVEHVDTRL
jgi:hypothetical protein